jgi:arylformamidase
MRSRLVIIHDISVPISESLVLWPGDPPVKITQSMHLDRGDMATVTRLDMGAHTGTHVDAPAHFIRGGADVAALDLDVLIGPALIVGALETEAITAEVLDTLAIPPDAERLLFRTRNSDYWASDRKEFARDFVAITEDGARWLVRRGVRLVGVDYLSIGPFENPVPAHKVLLRAGIVAVEGLNLHGIAPGVYRLVCLPLRISGSDGAPARAVLIEDSAV